ncbi:MAG: Uncharacterized protein CEN88_26 [Candidatus Berkelbacteria bacterium Licking1014_2]|uniref:DUF1573 domain-containing protein n=1 Tax=Candidatus Berkelbacteria bacterium Licking1014_2 TaxID=2017146 RepID=A0A554LX85_9BACT|nr:MAG: Uncharacterized protein CEN88_26 [Candidatus Berkelbacteria bacterium Licking1014_2]
MIKKVDPIMLAILIITVVIIVGVALSFGLSSNSKEGTYSSDNPNRPMLTIEEKEFDFGKTQLTETKTKDIKIKNVGNEPLVIKDFSTSCDCTFVEVKIDQEKSPRFSMHSSFRWRGELKPNQEALLIIGYQPNIMPVHGEVKRIVYFTTNDPENPKATIEFKAFVE